MRGWTLIEVLVALALWGLITALLARGFDVIIRSEQQQTEVPEQRDTQARCAGGGGHFVTIVLMFRGSATKIPPSFDPFARLLGWDCSAARPTW